MEMKWGTGKRRRKSPSAMASVGFLVIAASMLLFPVQGLGHVKTDEVKTLKIGYLLRLSGSIDVGPIP